MFGNNTINTDVIAKQCEYKNGAWGKRFYDKLLP